MVRSSLVVAVLQGSFGMNTRNRRREIESQDASPLAGWLHRFSAFVFIFLSAAFTIWFRLDEDFMNRARIIVGDVFRPITLAVHLPVSGVLRGLESIEDHFRTVEKLQNVQADIGRLEAMQEEINRLSARVMEAETLAKMPIDTVSDFLTLRVINDDSMMVAEALPEIVAVSNLVDRRLIKVNAGRLHGVQANYPVIGDVGVVGRVIWAGEETATIMLLYDVASSIPALIEPLNALVTVKGTGRRDGLEIKLAPSQALSEIQVGDRIVTSGQGELFPPGVLIGTVVAKQRGIEVEPAINWDRLVYVRVLPRSGVRR